MQSESSCLTDLRSKKHRLHLRSAVRGTTDFTRARHETTSARSTQSSRPLPIARLTRLPLFDRRSVRNRSTSHYRHARGRTRLTRRIRAHAPARHVPHRRAHDPTSLCYWRQFLRLLPMPPNLLTEHSNSSRQTSRNRPRRRLGTGWVSTLSPLRCT